MRNKFKNKNGSVFQVIFLGVNPCWVTSSWSRERANTWPSISTDGQEASSPSTSPVLLSLKVQFNGPADKPVSLLTRTGNDWTSGGQSLDFSWRFTSVSPSFCLHLFPPTGKSIGGVCRFLLKLFWYGYLCVLVFFLSFCVIQLFFFSNSVLSVTETVCLLDSFLLKGNQWGCLLQVERGRKKAHSLRLFVQFFP